ncbi:MAG: hypothetical protein WBY94_17180 [Polyangiaceae bacterium]
MRALVFLAGAALSGMACVGTTGGQLLSFPAAAAGPADTDPTRPFEFVTSRGWSVILTKAVLHVGALYLDQSSPVSGSQGTNCILPGTYVAQVTAGRDVDLLSPEPQLFPVAGQGTTIPPALVGQVWLTGGDVNSPDDTTPILVIAGTAAMGNATAMSFEATITIGANRQAAGQTAGSSAICKQRIVSVPTDVVVKPTGGLLVRVDPRALFTNVDFGGLQAEPDGTYVFSDEPSSPDYNQPSRNLFQNLESAGSLYQFAWSDSL